MALVDAHGFERRYIVTQFCPNGSLEDACFQAAGARKGRGGASKGGGGGHQAAAGARIVGKPLGIQRRVIAAIRDQLKSRTT